MEGERGSFAGNFSLSLTAKEEFVGRIVSSFWTSYRIGWLPAPKAFKYSDDRAFYVDIYHPNPITKRQQRGRRARQESAALKRGHLMQAAKVSKTLGEEQPQHSPSHALSGDARQTIWFISYTSKKWPTCPHLHADYKEFAKKTVTLRDILSPKAPAKIRCLDSLSWGSVTYLCNNRAIYIYCLSKAGIICLKHQICKELR